MALLNYFNNSSFIIVQRHTVSVKKSGENESQNKKSRHARALLLGDCHTSTFFFCFTAFLTLGLEFGTENTFLPM